MKEVINPVEVAKESIVLAKGLLGSVLKFTPVRMELVKRKLDEIYQEYMSKGVLTPEKFNYLMTPLFRELGIEDRISVQIANVLFERALKIYSDFAVNDVLKKMYEVYYDTENIELREIIDRIKKHYDGLNTISAKIAQTYVSVIESLDDTGKSEEELVKEIKEKFWEQLRNEIKKTEYLELVDKNKDFINRTLFGDIDEYDKIVGKYVTFKNADKEYQILANALKKELFKNLDGKELYGNLIANNFEEFYKNYIDPKNESDYEEIMNEMFKFVDYKDFLSEKEDEEVRALKKINEMIKRANSEENVENDEKFLNELQNTFEELGVDFNNNKYKLMSGIRKNIDYEAIEVKDLKPDEIEELKKRALDKYYINSIIDSLDLNKGITGKEENFLKQDGSLNVKKFQQYFLVPAKAKLLKCLGAATNPKYSYESGAGLAGHCVKEYIGEIEKAMNTLKEGLTSPGAREIMGFSGIALFLMLSKFYLYSLKIETEEKLTHIEKNYFEQKQLIEKINNPAELKMMNKFAELLSSPNKYFAVKMSSNKKDLNAFTSLAIKDLSNFYLEGYTDIDEFLDAKVNDILQEHIKNKKIKDINEISKIKEKIEKELKEKEKELKFDLIKGVAKFAKEKKEIIDIIATKKRIQEEIKEIIELKNKYLLERNELYLKGELENKDEVTKKIEEINKALLNRINRFEMLENRLKEIALNDDEKKMEKVEYTKKRIEELKKKLNELMEKSQELPFAASIKELNEYRNESNKIIEELEALEKEDKKDPYLEKIYEFVEKGRLIKGDYSYEEYAKFVRDITDDFELIDRVKNSKTGKEKEIIKEIYDKKAKFEGLITQEKILKDKIYDYLKTIKNKGEKSRKELGGLVEFLKKDEIRELGKLKDEMQYFAGIYAKNIELFDKLKSEVKELYEDLKNKVDKIDGQYVYLKVGEDNGEKNIITMPLKEFKDLEELKKLLENGNFFEAIELSDKQDLSMLLSYLKNNFDGYNRFKEIRKSEGNLLENEKFSKIEIEEINNDTFVIKAKKETSSKINEQLTGFFEKLQKIFESGKDMLNEENVTERKGLKV